MYSCSYESHVLYICKNNLIYKKSKQFYFISILCLKKNSLSFLTHPANTDRYIYLLFATTLWRIKPRIGSTIRLKTNHIKKLSSLNFVSNPTTNENVINKIAIMFLFLFHFTEMSMNLDLCQLGSLSHYNFYKLISNCFAEFKR